MDIYLSDFYNHNKFIKDNGGKKMTKIKEMINKGIEKIKDKKESNEKIKEIQSIWDYKCGNAYCGALFKLSGCRRLDPHSAAYAYQDHAAGTARNLFRLVGQYQYRRRDRLFVYQRRDRLFLRSARNLYGGGNHAGNDDPPALPDRARYEQRICS